MGVPQLALPDAAPVIGYAFSRSLTWVNRAIQCADPENYQAAVYNLAGDRLINWAQDTLPQTYFADQREQYDVTAFQAGVVSAAGDDGTNTSIQVAEGFKDLTAADLQNLKTPWGREYIGIAQSYGTVWGIS